MQKIVLIPVPSKHGDVLDVLDAIVERGSPSGANHALAAIRKCFNWCVERGLIESSPCGAIKKPARAEARDRVLSDEELRAIWKASDTIGALAAQRRTEVATMRWRDIDLSSGVWTIPAELTKNGKPHLLPFSALALARLASLPRLHESFVFPARGNATTTFSGFSKLKAKTERLSQVCEWTPHPAGPYVSRPTGEGRVAAACGGAHPQSESGVFRGVAGVYNRFQYLPEMREGLERWARHLEELMRT